MCVCVCVIVNFMPVALDVYTKKEKRDLSGIQTRVFQTMVECSYQHVHVREIHVHVHAHAYTCRSIVLEIVATQGPMVHSCLQRSTQQH